MSINKNGRKIKDRIHNGRFIARVYKNARLVYQRGSAQKLTKLIFDKSISDPKNITGYGEGPILDIIAKMRRCLCKAVSSWQTTITDTSWTKEKDPSPDGWRIPTSDELIALNEAYRSSWTTINGINGRRFGASNGSFFPAAGRRNSTTSTVTYQGTEGYYWSSTAYSVSYGYSLSFYSNNVSLSNNYNRLYGFAVRCVRDISTTNYAPCPAGETQVGNLIWANSNLSGNKTFCQNETDYGCYFQWGQNLPLSSDPNVTAAQLVHTKICYLDNYDSRNFANQWFGSIGTTSWSASDPSPRGWRIPTSAELAALDAAYRGGWENYGDGTFGRCFGKADLWFPASDYRDAVSGNVVGQVIIGKYWSSTPSSNSAYALSFTDSSVYPMEYSTKTSGFSVRCVRNTTVTDYLQCPAGEIQIDNVVWAKSNLKTAGEFCEKENDFGCYFQWGQNSALSSDSNVSVAKVAPTLTGSDGDVMVYMPKFWYKYVPDPLGTGNSFGYDLSLEPISGGIHINESLLGAYKSRNVSSKLYSRSGVASSGNFSQTSNINYAKVRGQGYNIIDFEQHSMIALLFYAKYGNRNSQAVLGAGGASYSASNGSTNSLGNRDTVTATSGHASFVGIEGVHGCAYEWVSGVNINNRVWTVTNPDGTTRVIGTAPSSNSYITEIAAANGPYFDLMPITASGGGSSIYYTDYYSQNTNSCVLARSYDYTHTSGGVSCTQANVDSSYNGTSIASRLSYRGTIIEEPNATAFKALPIIN